MNEDQAHKEGTKTHSDYIYDIGEFPVQQANLQKFRNTYSTSRGEYSAHAFKTKIGGETHTVRVPRNVAREIHLLCEARAHPLTFHQKLRILLVCVRLHNTGRARLYTRLYVYNTRTQHET